MGKNQAFTRFYTKPSKYRKKDLQNYPILSSFSMIVTVTTCLSIAARQIFPYQTVHASSTAFDFAIILNTKGSFLSEFMAFVTIKLLPHLEIIIIH